MGTATGVEQENSYTLCKKLRKDITMTLMINEIPDMEPKDVTLVLFEDYLDLCESVRILRSVNNNLTSQLTTARDKVEELENKFEGFRIEDV